MTIKVIGYNDIEIWIILYILILNQRREEQLNLNSILPEDIIEEGNYDN